MGSSGRPSKRRKREQLRAWLKTVAELPPRDRGEIHDPNLCFSATCAECRRTWISAVRPIKPNAKRGGQRVYLCGNCR